MSAVEVVQVGPSVQRHLFDQRRNVPLTRVPEGRARVVGQAVGDSLAEEQALESVPRKFLLRVSVLPAPRPRARAWAAGAAPKEIVIDIDGTLLDAHLDKQDATLTCKRGFYPILGYLDATGEGLAGVLRPGRAGSNNAADHLVVLDAALAQLPVSPADAEIVMRTDTAGATHDFIDGCADRGVGFLVGLPVDAAVRDAFMLVQEEDWIPAVETDGRVRDGAWLVELTGLLDHGWVRRRGRSPAASGPIPAPS